MNIKNRHILISFLAVLLFGCFVAYWFVIADKIDSESGVSGKHSMTPEVLLEQSVIEPMPAGEKAKAIALKQQVTDGSLEDAIALPQVPKALLGVREFSEIELERITQALPKIRDKEVNYVSRFEFHTLDLTESEKLARLSGLLKEVDNGEPAAIFVLHKNATSCGHKWGNKKVCQEIEMWRENEKLAGKPHYLIDRIDKLALSGDLQAQYAYPLMLDKAVFSREMNTAIDGPLWLDRRHRMIEYLLKFTKAGDFGMAFLLGVTFESNYFIESNIFWATVFQKQSVLLSNGQLGSGDYLPIHERMIDYHKLDAKKIEKARQVFFGD